MKLAAFAIIVSLVAIGMGCQTVHPAPGLAAVQVRVIAKPKAGVNAPVSRVDVYGAATDAAPEDLGIYERVDYANLTDIIVWLEPASGSAGSTMPAASMANVDLNVDADATSLAVQAASIGRPIVFRNRSGQAIALYSVSDGNEFNLPPMAPGATAEFTPRAQGLIEILYDSSKPPVALIYAAPSGWIVRAKSGETITLNNVPAGSYRLMTWHPRLPGSEQQINVAADQVTRSTVTIGVNSLPPAGSR